MPIPSAIMRFASTRDTVATPTAPHRGRLWITSEAGCRSSLGSAAMNMNMNPDPDGRAFPGTVPPPPATGLAGPAEPASARSRRQAHAPDTAAPDTAGLDTAGRGRVRRIGRARGHRPITALRTPRGISASSPRPLPRIHGAPSTNTGPLDEGGSGKFPRQCPVTAVTSRASRTDPSGEADAAGARQGVEHPCFEGAGHVDAVAELGVGQITVTVNTMIRRSPRGSTAGSGTARPSTGGRPRRAAARASAGVGARARGTRDRCQGQHHPRPRGHDRRRRRRPHVGALAYLPELVGERQRLRLGPGSARAAVAALLATVGLHLDGAALDEVTEQVRVRAGGS